jgi:hypothetical protein
MLQARSRRRVYWVHAIWIINVFLYLVVAWWIFYRWRLSVCLRTKFRSTIQNENGRTSR